MNPYELTGGRCPMHPLHGVPCGLCAKTSAVPHQETAPLTAIRTPRDASTIDRASVLRLAHLIGDLACGNEGVVNPEHDPATCDVCNAIADRLVDFFTPDPDHFALASPLAEGDEMKEHDQDVARRVTQAHAIDDPPQPAAGDTSTVSVADSLPKCGHQNALVDNYRTETLSDGVTIRVRTPRRFTVTKNQRFCLECGQLVDSDHSS